MPSRLSGLEERERILVEWNATRSEYPRRSTIHEVFARRAAERPDAVALSFGADQITYRELLGRAHALAWRLRELGAGPDVPVGVSSHRRSEVVIALLAILQAGGAYVPLDPELPPERLRFLIEDTGIRLLLSDDPEREELDAPGVQRLELLREASHTPRGEPPPDLAGPDHLAYILFTSGSTGQPKGVEVPHRAVLRLLFGVDYADLGPEEVLLQLAPLSFDASTFELWGALLHGARCVLYPGRVPRLDELARVLREERVSSLWLTASLFNQVIDEAPETLASVRQLLTGGEALSLPHVERALEALPGTRLINGYGPTESTTFACCFTITAKSIADRASVPIGRPIANTTAYILDPDARPVPVGSPGELHLGGDGLARGYRNRPELTRERFLPDPFSGEAGARMYRTGDRCRWLPDGTIEFLGRFDDQLKIRGFRVEPGEIDAALERHPAVRRAVTRARKLPDGTRGLATCWLPEPGQDPVDPGELEEYLAERLPAYMVPRAWAELEELPLTASGKVDRQRLPEIEVRHEQYEEPRGKTEERVAQVFREVLSLERVGRHDDFFALGGHSLLAARLVHRLHGAFGAWIPLEALFEAPTVARLSRRVSEARPELFTSTLVPIRRGDNARRPLFLLPGIGGHSLAFHDLAGRIDTRCPILALQLRGLDGRAEPHSSIEEMATFFIAEARRVQPVGPYRLAGYSLGGLIAFEMAKQLAATGERVDLLALIGSWAPGYPPTAESRITRIGIRLRDLLQLDLPDQVRCVRSHLAFVARRWSGRLRLLGAGLRGRPQPVILRNVAKVKRAAIQGYRRYAPGAYRGSALVIRESRVSRYLLKLYNDPRAGWESCVEGAIDAHLLDADHVGLLKEPAVTRLAEILATRLDT